MNVDIPKSFDNNNKPDCQGIEEAVKRFESIMMSRIYVQQRLADRLKNSIRVGMLVLFLLAVSIFALLWTLSIQVSRVSESIIFMNENFVNISDNMEHINNYMINMEKQVAYLPKIKDKTAIFDQQMHLMNNEFVNIRKEMYIMSDNIVVMENKVKQLSSSMVQMDNQVGNLTYDTHKISKPAKSMNKFFPF